MSPQLNEGEVAFKGKERGLVARNRLITWLLVLAALLLAVLLFVAGAIWRGRLASDTKDLRTRENLVCFAVVGFGHSRPNPDGWSAIRK